MFPEKILAKETNFNVSSCNPHACITTFYLLKASYRSHSRAQNSHTVLWHPGRSQPGSHAPHMGNLHTCITVTVYCTCMWSQKMSTNAKVLYWCSHRVRLCQWVIVHCYNYLIPEEVCHSFSYQAARVLDLLWPDTPYIPWISVFATLSSICLE